MPPPAINRCLGAVGLLACAAWIGCRPGGAGDHRPLVVVVSGDTEGWIVPCGCASNQSGGLPRRGTYVKQLRDQAEVIVADVGGAPGGTSLYDRAKFEAILQGELAMGIAAHNIGAAEAALGAHELRRLAKDLGVPLLSANVRDREGQPLAEPMRIVEAAGRRVALVGVLGEQYATDELEVAPPCQAVLDALRQAAGKYDSVVVLAYLKEQELQQLADTLPEAHVVVGGPTGQPFPPTPIGPTLLASATNRGKFLACFNPPTAESPGHWTGSIVELSGKFADDPQQVANLKRFYEELARRDFTPDQTSLAERLPSNLPGSRQIAGTESCRKCHQHEDECRAWDDSKHARAWNSLQEKGTHVDPDCQRCHTTGYGLPGGFASVKRSAGLVHVGCESCHGPSQAHVDDEKVHTTYYSRAKDRCVGCHDRENSPQFAYHEYWARIRHGESTAGESVAAYSAEPSEESR